MKYRTNRAFGWLLCALFCQTTNPVFSQNQPLEHYESAFLAQDRYPAEGANFDWFPDDHEIQGVTNDGSNWFFTIVDQDKTNGILWRIPKSVPLNGHVGGNAGSMKIELGDVPPLKSLNFWHWGDPDHAHYNGIDYILVPTGSAIAVFEANNLAFVNYALLDGNVDAGWCAVGKDNDLYMTANDPNAIYRYAIDWEKLVHSADNGAITFAESFPLIKKDGSPLQLFNMQGGEFTPTGEMLYLISGRGECFGFGEPWGPTDGIHAITTHDWREVDHSIKNSDASNYFSYDYDPTCFTCWTGGGSETPEGLTFWDLDDESSPGIRGSLHVLVDHYTYGGWGCDDEVKFHHYSRNLFVDKNANGGGPGLPGRADHAFKTINEAIGHYPIWDGARLAIRAGNYPETFFLNKRVQLGSEGGPVTIGKN